VNKRAYIAIALVVVIAVVSVLAFSGSSLQATPAAAENAPATPPVTATDTPVSSPAPETVAAPVNSNGFQYLISYTDGGFEPLSLLVKKGETVRFTNNSQGGLWVASVARPGATVYPGRSDCGASAFGTCAALKPGDFWEFTFDVAGTWSYKNISDSSKTGTVTVK